MAQERLSTLYWNVRARLSHLSLARFLSVARSRFFDVRYGVETAGTVEIDELGIGEAAQQYARRYHASKIEIVRCLLSKLRIPRDEFTFIDVGCGKGLCLILAAEAGFRKAVGVEISPLLTKVGRRNVERYRKRTRSDCEFELHCLDAREFILPDEKALLYFYNPFDRSVVESVLSSIGASLRRKPLELFILYVVPSCAELFDAAEFLELVEEGQMSGDAYRIYASTVASRGGGNPRPLMPGPGAPRPPRDSNR